MSDIFYKGYKILCESVENNSVISYKAKVLGRDSGCYIGIGNSPEVAFKKLKEKIDEFR